MMLPSKHTISELPRRAAMRQFLPALRGGFTGVVGTLKNGKGPTLGMRFEMDALDIPESNSPEHRPSARDLLPSTQG